MHQPEDHTQRNLAYALLGGYFTVVLLILVLQLAVSEQLKTLLDIMTTSVVLVLGYYFGSSRGSAAKTDALAEAANKKLL